MLADLNVPWPENPNPSSLACLSRTLAVIADVGYTVVALNHFIDPSKVIDTSKSNKSKKNNSNNNNNNNNISLESPIDVSLLPVPVPSRLTVLTRATVILDDFTAANSSIIQKLPYLSLQYDILAVRPTTERSLLLACTSYDAFNVISLDMTTRLPCFLRHKTIGAAISRGMVFEICYAGGKDPSTYNGLGGSSLGYNATSTSSGTGAGRYSVASSAFGGGTGGGYRNMDNNTTSYNNASASSASTKAALLGGGFQKPSATAMNNMDYTTLLVDEAGASNSAIFSIESRKNLISNATSIIRAIRGKRAIIVSSEAYSPYVIRGPYDVVNLATTWGLDHMRSRDSISKIGMTVIKAAQLRRSSYKQVIMLAKKRHTPDEDDYDLQQDEPQQHTINEETVEKVNNHRDEEDHDMQQDLDLDYNPVKRRKIV